MPSRAWKPGQLVCGSLGYKVEYRNPTYGLGSQDKVWNHHSKKIGAMVTSNDVLNARLTGFPSVPI